MKKFDEIKADALRTARIENDAIRRRCEHLKENEVWLKLERLRRQQLRDIEMRGR